MSQPTDTLAKILAESERLKRLADEAGLMTISERLSVAIEHARAELARANAGNFKPRA